MLPQLLLVVAATELAIYRLAVPALRPSDGDDPPAWHAALSYAALFLFYFASAFAIAILVRELVRFARGESPAAPRLIGRVLVLTGAMLLTYAVKSLIVVPGATDTFLLELAFALSLAALLAAQLRRGGDTAVKVGILFLAVPLLVHFYRDAAVRWWFAPEALWEGAADRVDAYGQWSLVLAALLSPYCFAPRPFADAAGKPAPLAIGAFVGLVGALVVRQSYEVGYLLAKRGVGVDLGAGAPTSQIALYLIALGSITWTLVSCFMAPSPARRRVGVGLGLIVASGYGFAWPLQYLAGLVGFLTISDAARDVAGEEHAARGAEKVRFRGPAIRPDAWQSYVGALVAALRARGYQASTVSVEDRTHVLVLEASRVPVRLMVDRGDDSIRVIEVVCGRDLQDALTPAWTLETRSRRLGSAHPPPPKVRAPRVRTGDAEFDRRFRVRDEGRLTGRLFDDGLRARATALLDGWLAFWPGQSLVYRVVPGQGAPLDTPIPVTQLSFGGDGGPAGVDRLVTLIELLAQIADRAIGDDWSRRAPTDDPA
ncbi:MAG TPA: hypothetical protein VMZ28_00010 [Kofleriaceae bacterium]|nr:hypothetical protein [Kofleriaceae bacterium]